MRFRSTVNKQPTFSFKEAILDCLPEDGGLYVPDYVIDMRQFFLHMDETTSFSELVASVTPLLFEGELSPPAASRIAESAFDFEPELYPLDDNFFLLNLYNGPTGTFKDFGNAFLAALLDEILSDWQTGESLTLVSAVSDKSGAGIARAYQNRRRINNILLYPAGPVRGLPDTADSAREGPGSLLALQIDGTLDDCQRLVHALIRDRPFARRYRISCGNAINPGRLLPQAFYYLYAFTRIKKRLSGELVFSIPSGNFGNLIAALYAWKFGMPVNGFLAAMNSNNAFGDFFRGGVFNPRPLVSTMSPALDVSCPANYERLKSFYSVAPLVMKTMVYPYSISDGETEETMRSVWQRYGVLLDPHGAVAFASARRHAADREFNGQIVVLATGHPARYADAVFKASGERLEMPEKLASLHHESKNITHIENRLEALEKAIEQHIF